jgi:hypothetical protein
LSKKEYLGAFLMIVAIMLAIGASCLGCGSPSASTDTNIDNTASVDVGNVETGPVNVGTQETTVVVGGGCDCKERVNWPLWGTVWVWSVVLMYGWISGNLHPTKPKHGKGGEKDEGK